MAMTQKLILIDDDLTALDLLDLLFERNGFEVQRFTDGATAMQKLERIDAAAVVVDLMMPGMDGKACIEEIRARGYNGPIIAFTAIDDPEVHVAVQSAGCDLVLTKPCRPNELLIYVKDEIEKKTAGIIRN